MKKSLIITLVLFASFSTGMAQNLNSFKYVVVPDEYDFLKEENQYQLNTLTKFLFEKYGFEAYMEKEDSPGSTANRCETLFADVEKDSGLFTTKLELILKDCRNNVVFSAEGRSREKEYKAAYHEALRNAFEPLEALEYKYKPGNAVISAEGKQDSEQKVEGEVKKTSPEKSKKADLGVSEGEISSAAENKMFMLDNNVYYLEKSDKGYNFFQQGMNEPFAALIASKTGDNFIYSSINNQGIAYFNAKGNLVVEILNSENSTDTREYILQDQ